MKPRSAERNGLGDSAQYAQAIPPTAASAAQTDRVFSGSGMLRGGEAPIGAHPDHRGDEPSLKRLSGELRVNFCFESLAVLDIENLTFMII